MSETALSASKLLPSPGMFNTWDLMKHTALAALSLRDALVYPLDGRTDPQPSVDKHSLDDARFQRRQSQRTFS